MSNKSNDLERTLAGLRPLPTRPPKPPALVKAAIGAAGLTVAAAGCGDDGGSTPDAAMDSDIVTPMPPPRPGPPDGDVVDYNEAGHDAARDGDPPPMPPPMPPPLPPPPMPDPGS